MTFERDLETVRNYIASSAVVINEDGHSVLYHEAHQADQALIRLEQNIQKLLVGAVPVNRWRFYQMTIRRHRKHGGRRQAWSYALRHWRFWRGAA